MSDRFKSIRRLIDETGTVALPHEDVVALLGEVDRLREEKCDCPYETERELVSVMDRYREAIEKHRNRKGALGDIHEGPPRKYDCRDVDERLWAALAEEDDQ